MMKPLLSLLFTFIILTSCQKDLAIEDGSLPAISYTNTSYGSHALQTMDIFLPAGRTDDSTRAIVLIHGGAWNTGDKTDFADYINSIKQRLPDYAIFNLNYRLATGPLFLFPTQENDIKAALDFIASKANEFHFNENKIVILGASAGGHLAMLHAFKNATNIAAVVDFYGPTDLVDMYNNPANAIVPIGLQMVTGTTPTGNLQLYQESSPINYVSTQSPPTLILHGALDNLVSISQSIQLKNTLDGLGITSQLVTYPNEGHAWFGATLEDSFDKIQVFLNANVQ